MSDTVIRPATANDITTIKAMVNRERLNPFNLDWQHFLIVECDNQIAAIGQIKPHKDCEELASLVTNPHYRGQGIASTLIAELESRAGRPLYLRCAGDMESFYQKFDYESISWRDAPQSLKFFGLFIAFVGLLGIEGRLMRKI